MPPAGMGAGPVYPPDRLLSTPWLLPLSIGSLYSGTYVMHELGLGPGSGCYQGSSVGRRGHISDRWIIGKSIGAWVK